jgi:hypothetical protein
MSSIPYVPEWSRMQRGLATRQSFGSRSVSFPNPQQGAQALAADTAGLAVTDAAGRGQTQPLPAGRYYVFNSVHISNKPMMWNLPVDLKAGANTLTLDQHNLTLVQ